MYLPVELVELKKVQLMPESKRSRISVKSKGQPEIIHPVKSQSKYLASKSKL